MKKRQLRACEPRIPAGDAVATSCAYCGVGCGLVVHHDGGGQLRLTGDAEHPANQGRLCLKGATLLSTLDDEGRILAPEVHGRVAPWDDALDAVARTFRDTIRAHGPEAVAFYVSGQLLTEDYYVANKLMKGFLGSANIDTNSRLCMAAPAVAQRRAFGADAVPGCYEDLDLCDLVVLVGSNLAECHPVLHRRLVERKAGGAGPKLVVIDPRRSATARDADLFLPLAPGSDAALFLGLLHHLKKHDALDLVYLERHVRGFGEAFAAARDWTIPLTARTTGLPEELVVRFFSLFTRTARTVTLYSQGVNQSTSGTDKIAAILNCHLATGRLGRPGMGPFALTGQGNAMGGREVGGLATQLAAHMGFDDPDDHAAVSAFWQAPALASRPGLTALEIFAAVRSGKIKALWIMATNPLVSLPDATEAERALRRCPFVVVSECFRASVTTRLAHVLLPALGWGEKDGTVTNSERLIARQRAFRAPPGQARADWWILTQVARRMGFATAFPYERPAEIFREHATLTTVRNGGRRVFDIGALAELSDAAYDALRPCQWPVGKATRQGTARLFSDGRFSTQDGRAVMATVSHRPPAHTPDGDFPFVLTTGRVRDQWHTMTRTGRVARLCLEDAEPFAALHPDDAAPLLVEEASGLVRITSRWGSFVARVRSSPEQARRTLFAPFHWSEAQGVGITVNAAVNPDADPLSGQPELKHTPVKVEPFRARWHGVVLTRGGLDFTGLPFWLRVERPAFVRHELAATEPPPRFAAWLARRLGVDAPAPAIELSDTGGAGYRAAWLKEGRVECLAFFTTSAPLPRRTLLESWFEKTSLTALDRLAILSCGPLKECAS
jgi:assimilatory nitrate reductase catalytic subunit